MSYVRSKPIIGALLLLLLDSITAQAASFDCKRATNAIERIICSDVELSNMDDDLAKIYLQILLSMPERSKILKAGQRKWIKCIRNKSTDVKSLKLLYMDRINVLKSLRRTNVDTIFGEWEPYSRAFYDSGIIKITSSELTYEPCKTKFKHISTNGNQYYYEAQFKQSCHAISSKYSVNFIKVNIVGEEISVRYYISHDENSLLGEDGYSRVDRGADR